MHPADLVILVTKKKLLKKQEGAKNRLESPSPEHVALFSSASKEIAAQLQKNLNCQKKAMIVVQAQSVLKVQALVMQKLEILEMLKVAVSFFP